MTGSDGTDRADTGRATGHQSKTGGTPAPCAPAAEGTVSHHERTEGSDSQADEEECRPYRWLG